MHGQNHIKFQMKVSFQHNTNTFWKHKIQQMIEGQSIPNSMKELNLTYNNTELDWAEWHAQLHERGEVNSPAMQSHPNLQETVTEGRNNGIKMRDHKSYKSQIRRFSDIEALLYLVSFMLQLTGRCLLRWFLMMIIGLARSIHGTHIRAITTSILCSTCWKQKYSVQ